MIGSAIIASRVPSRVAEAAMSVSTSLARATDAVGVGLLSLEGIEAGYGKKTILHGLSLVAQPGAITALLGVNGAGKSTTLKVIMGLIVPTAGSVRLGDREITRLSTSERVAMGLGYLGQGGRVFPSLSVRENIVVATKVLPRAMRTEAIDGALAHSEVLRSKSAVRAGLLSGGERHALAFAMLMACGPKLVLLDEPTAGIAPGLARAFLQEIATETRKRGITALLVEQNVGLALEIADQAIAMISGRVAMTTATPAEWRSEGALNAILQDFTR